MGEISAAGEAAYADGMKHYSDVDAYLAEAELWPAEITALRPILTDAGLDEEIKWGKPCYSHDGANIVILQEMKDFLAAMFFKGALLDDAAGLLQSQGPNTRSAMRVQFTSVDEVNDLADTMRDYIQNAIEVEDAGLEIEPAPEMELVEELQERLASDPDLADAFYSLTPGRQRGYNLHFADAKKSETRASRVEKYVSKILAGKGMHDR